MGGHGFRRTPFSVISKPRVISSILLPCQKLEYLSPLPSYQFVQDIEDQADLIIHRSKATEVAVVNETDSFWFFSLETAGLASEGDGKELASSNFLLFLPDRDLAGKVGQGKLLTEDSLDQTQTE